MGTRTYLIFILEEVKKRKKESNFKENHVRNKNYCIDSCTPWSN